MRRWALLLFAGLVLGGAQACRCDSAAGVQGRPAVYYWKTSLSLSPAEGAALQAQGIRRVYLRQFDLDWPKASPRPILRAPLQAKAGAAEALAGFEVVPVYFITTAALKGGQDGPLVAALVQQVDASEWGRRASEVQVDADWTPQTREAYFRVLSGLRRHLGLRASKPLLSATLRLHQARFIDANGLPPCDKAMLMVYHTSKVYGGPELDSILDAGEAAKYRRYIQAYPLPLDLALPIFSWAVHFNAQGRGMGLVHRLDVSDLSPAQGFEKSGSRTWTVRRRQYRDGSLLREGDTLRLDRPGLTTLLDVSGQYLGLLHQSSPVLAFFDHDPRSWDRLLAEDPAAIKRICHAP